MFDHGAQLQWKGPFGTFINPPCQQSLCEETAVPGKKPTTFAGTLTNSSQERHELDNM